VIINLRDTPKPEMRSILRMLDTLERLGCNIDLPAARKVRKLAKRHGEIAAEKRTEAGSAADIQTATARDLAAGKISAGDVRSAAVAATLSADGASTLHKIYDRALAILSRQARDHLAELGDRWITDVLRPVVDQTAARILADIPANMAPAIRPRDPDSEALVAGRLDAQVAHTQLRELHGVAHQLRVLRCIPATPRDVTCWEWDTSLGYRGRPDTTLAGFIHTAHNGSTPGIYTEAEAAAVEEANPTREVDPIALEAARGRLAARVHG
jgi:hypothetical protein